MPDAPNTSLALDQACEGVLRRLTDTHRAVVGAGWNLETMLRFVKALRAALDDLNAAAAVPNELTGFVSSGVLQAAFPVFVSWRHGDFDRASATLCHTWADHVAMAGPTQVPTAWSARAAAPLHFEPADSEHLSLFNVAVGACLRDASADAEGRRTLRRLIVALDLSYDQAGGALGVTGETVRRWERGMVLVPTRRLSALTSADAALSRLLGLFRPERLPVAIRRPAALFDGESALDWILRGRIHEVADRYDLALSYQA